MNGSADQDDTEDIPTHRENSPQEMRVETFLRLGSTNKTDRQAIPLDSLEILSFGEILLRLSQDEDTMSRMRTQINGAISSALSTTRSFQK